MVILIRNGCNTFRKYIKIGASDRDKILFFYSSLFFKLSDISFLIVTSKENGIKEIYTKKTIHCGIACCMKNMRIMSNVLATFELVYLQTRCSHQYNSCRKNI